MFFRKPFPGATSKPLIPNMTVVKLRIQTGYGQNLKKFEMTRKKTSVFLLVNMKKRLIEKK